MGYAHRYFLVYDTRSRITIRQEMVDHPKPNRINSSRTTAGVLVGSNDTIKPITAKGIMQ